jgi:hypothetical protein
MEFVTKTRRLAIRAGLLLAGLAALAIFVNLSWFDEPLNPEIERLRAPEPVSMQDNAFPLIYGFPSADDRDPLRTGVAIVEALRDRYRQGRAIGLDAEEMANLLGGSKLDDAWQAGFQSLSCNSRLSLECADPLLAELKGGAPLPPRLDLLVARYERMLAAPRFEENEEFDVTTPTPAYGLVMRVGRIRLARSLLQDPADTFLARAAEDLAFWRKMLREGRSLIAKMVALAGIRNDLELLSAAMRDRRFDDDQIASLRSFLRPLSAEERDIGEAFLSELRILLLSHKTVAFVPSDPSWAIRLLLQKNATLNEYYLTSVTPLRLRASLDARTFFEQHGFERLTYSLRFFPPPLYNLGGKLLLKRQAASYNVQDYISRVHDLDGRIALVLLQAEIEQSPERSVADVVNASAHRNPYTGEPMHYDAAAGTVGFECLTENRHDVCTVRLGGPSR